MSAGSGHDKGRDSVHVQWCSLTLQSSSQDLSARFLRTIVMAAMTTYFLCSEDVLALSTGDGRAPTGVPHCHRGRGFKRRFVVLCTICGMIAVTIMSRAMVVVTSIGTVGLLLESLVSHLQHATLLLPQLSFLFAAAKRGLQKRKDTQCFLVRCPRFGGGYVPGIPRGEGRSQRGAGYLACSAQCPGYACATLCPPASQSATGRMACVTGATGAEADCGTGEGTIGSEGNRCARVSMRRYSAIASSYDGNDACCDTCEKYGPQAARQVVPQSGCPEIPMENRIEADECCIRKC